MDLRQLKYFIAVAEELNIGRAATRLHISQPPLTRQIQQLEEELETQLFIRTNRGVALTASGELFLQEARNVHSLLELSTERVKRSGQGKYGRLDVGIFGSSIMNIIPQILLLYRKHYPDVEVVLHTMTKQEQIEALRQRRISVSFNRMIAPEEDIETTLVATEALLLAVPADHVLAKKKSVRFIDLADFPMVLFPSGARPNFIDRVYRFCAEKGFQPKVSQEVGDAVTGVALVASGFGTCLVPHSATTLRFPGVVYREVSEPPREFFVDLSCMCLKEDTSPLVRGFLGVVREYRARHMVDE